VAGWRTARVIFWGLQIRPLVVNVARVASVSLWEASLFDFYFVVLGGGGILGMTGKMTLPKAESVWIKNP